MRIQLYKHPSLAKIPKTPSEYAKYGLQFHVENWEGYRYCENCDSEFYGQWRHHYKIHFKIDYNRDSEKNKARDNFREYVLTQIPQLYNDSGFLCEFAIKEEYDFAVNSVVKFYRLDKCPVCGAPLERKRGYLSLSLDTRFALRDLLSDDEKMELEENENQYSDDMFSDNKESGVASELSRGEITKRALSVFPGIKKAELSVWFGDDDDDDDDDDYDVNYSPDEVFVLLRWRRPLAQHDYQKKTSSFLSTCAMQIIDDSPKVVNTVKSSTFLQEYLLHIIKLETEIYSASQYLTHLYAQQHDVPNRLKAEKYLIEQAAQEKNAAFSAKIITLQKELDILRAQEITVVVNENEVGMQEPTKPLEPEQPLYKTPGLFNKKAILQYNDDLKRQYEQKVQEYHVAFERYTADLNAYKKAYQQKMDAAQRQHQAKIASVKSQLESLQAQEKELNSRRPTVEPINTALTTLTSDLDKEVSDFEALIKKLVETRASLYNYNIVYGKYRDIVAISTFYEYLMSGRCDSLEGASGAYNLYETECRANKIISQLDKVVDSLESIKNTQFMVYDQLQKANLHLKNMQSSLHGAVKHLSNISAATTTIANNTSEIAHNTSMIAHNTAVAAYYSKVNAELTNALGFMAALK